MHPRPPLLIVLLLALGSVLPAARAGQTVTTPLLRVAEPSGAAGGSVQVKVKGQGSSVSVKVFKLDAGVATPLGVFLEDEPLGGTFTQVAGIASLAKGAGKITLTSTDGPPEELDIGSLDELAGRLLEVRDANGAALLDALLPGLEPFAGTKLTAKLAPPEGAPAPAASATLSGKPKAAKGSERFRIKAKKLPAGATVALFVEDEAGSGSFLPAGDFLGSLYQRDTAAGDRLPLEVAAHADLVDRAVEVRDGETVLLAGTIAVKGKPGLTFPLVGVIILEAGPGGDDRYLRVVGLDGPLYRSIVDLTQVSPQELAEEGEALWRIDKIGQTADGPLVTVTLEGHDDTWWRSAITGGTHFVHVQKQNVDPAGLDDAHFILHMNEPWDGKPSFVIESAYYASEFLQDEGHILTANGVKIEPGGAATFVLY